ncbi:MAG: molybdopterin-dependent oxidoreductase [Flavobacteriaceae bacterium]|nr:MAG: molybdopterin-dependent oxidoreductase [Flavobacteriaceae bacterium]
MAGKRNYKTTCSYCGVGCGIIVKKDAKNKISVQGDPDHPVNKGMLCSKGMNLNYVVQNTSDRIVFPEMKWSKNHPLERVSWDVAIKRAAAVFSSIIDRYGPDSVGFYVSGQCLTEEYYIINKLAKGFVGTNNIDTNSRLCMSSAVVGYKKTIGDDAVPISYDDIELADCFVIAGANPAWCHPILFRRLELHKEKNPKVKIIAVDPRKTATTAIADLHLQIIPGTDVILYNAIARRLIEKNQIDKKFIKEHAENYEQLKNLVFKTSLREASKICGISINEIKKAAQIIGHSINFISMWTMGLNQSVIGVDKNVSLLNLSLLTGQIGKPGSGPFSLTGQPNAMGGREVGGMANLLAAHKDLSNPIHRKEVQDYWGSKEIQEKPGLTATEMFDAIENGSLKAIWIVCTNPVVSLPESTKIEKALKKANFVIVQDISHSSETTKYADLLLPAAGWLEKEGVMTNSERRLSYLEKGIDPPGEALPDVEIFQRFAKAMNFPGFDYENSGEIFEEYCRLTKNTNIDISGLSYNRLKKEGSMQWPVPDTDHKGTSRLFLDRKFFTKSGKAQFIVPGRILNESETTTADFPLILTTGRIRDQWHTRTRTGKVKKLGTHIPSPYLEMNKVDAYERGIKEADVVIIKSRRGKIRVTAKLNYDIRRGVVFMPMHWGKILNNDYGRVNNITNNLIDPISKEPDYKYSAVEVEKFKKKTEKICIVGAGAAAYRFIQSYREHNTEDEIAVFSKEKDPFYNRVLLPEYVSDELSWEDLQKIKEKEIDKLGVQLFSGISIKHIDRRHHIITDSNDQEHKYDKLILATGSRPFVPANAQLEKPGRFTLRNRGDAERLKEHLKKSGVRPSDQHVVIVGGGLLGLELAATLNKKNIQITIVQRASRLMERQLDLVASRILAEDVQERGIQIYFDNEVSTVFEDEDPNTLEITLKTGKVIYADAIVYAIGTIPNIEIAKNAKINCRRGAIVNHHLQTNDPSIFALGEIAEFNNNLYGITSAAEQQAEIAVNFLMGDYTSIYSGSVLMNILKFDDLDLCSIGVVNFPRSDNSVEEVIFTDLNKRYYKKCIIRNDRLIGAILIGDKNEFAEYKSLIEEEIELGDLRDKILRSNEQSTPVLGKIICSCSQIGQGNLEEIIESGCSSFNELCKSSGAGMGCGSCKPEVKAIFDKNSTLKVSTV